MTYGKLSSIPQCVRRIESTTTPKPGSTKNIPSMSAVAAMRQRTQTASAMETKEIKAIHNIPPAKMEPASQRLSHPQPCPCSSACSRKRTRAGIQVVQESNVAITETLPKRYSARESGRLKYSCTEWMAKSLEIIPGAPQAVSRKPIQPSNERKPRNQKLLINGVGPN